MVWPLTQAEQELTAEVIVSKGLRDDDNGKDGDGDDETPLSSQVLSQGLRGTYLTLTATLEGDAIMINILKMRTSCPGGSVASPGLTAGKRQGLDLSSGGLPGPMPLSTLPCDAVVRNLGCNVMMFYISNLDIRALELSWL